MRILITGDNGFIGSYITTELLKNNYEVICCIEMLNLPVKNALLQK
ncbi:NAD-dependent epimerase/dehydratase family protein [Rickettsia australis]|uniref:Putative oxidoreductase protein n=1 Tax=Rickettsia australis (strain Cutlack) TaxID=1105110 RepID=H8K6H8_RICAC|nr:NAD-dependent epimerase/dehydratase family protein [Rickettsia australis]AFC70871.1 Putative oxidoreductase protein [Rickettsia australis str. Cutlack]